MMQEPEEAEAPLGTYPNLTQEQFFRSYLHLCSETKDKEPAKLSLDILLETLREKVEGAINPEENEFQEPLRVFGALRAGLRTRALNTTRADELPSLEEVHQACRLMWKMRNTVGKFNHFRRDKLGAALTDLEGILGLDSQLSRPGKESLAASGSLDQSQFPPVNEEGWEFLLRHTVGESKPFGAPLVRLIEDFAPPPDAKSDVREAMATLIAAHDAIVAHFTARADIPQRIGKDAAPSLPDQDRIASALTAYEKQVNTYPVQDKIRAKKILENVRAGFGIAAERTNAVGG